jgi:hypothetical protein
VPCRRRAGASATTTSGLTRASRRFAVRRSQSWNRQARQVRTRKGCWTALCSHAGRPHKPLLLFPDLAHLAAWRFEFGRTPRDHNPVDVRRAAASARNARSRRPGRRRSRELRHREPGLRWRATSPSRSHRRARRLAPPASLPTPRDGDPAVLAARAGAPAVASSRARRRRRQRSRSRGHRMRS